eukprot:s257_g12.t1
MLRTKRANDYRRIDVDKADGKKCRSCQAFALTIEDLDYPNGMGSADNAVHNIFWIANIPGDWMAINQTAVDELSEFAPTMVVGRNSKGDLGMEPPCPSKGMHRYHVVMWSLDSQLDDIDADITYGALKSLLEAGLDRTGSDWLISFRVFFPMQAKLTAEALAQLEDCDAASSASTYFNHEDQDEGAEAAEAPKKASRRRDRGKDAKEDAKDGKDGKETKETWLMASEGAQEGGEEDPAGASLRNGQGPPGAPTGFTMKWDCEAEESLTPQGEEAKFEDLRLYHVGTPHNEVAIIVIPDIWGWQSPRVRLLADFAAKAVNGYAVDNPPYKDGPHDDGVPEDFRIENLDRRHGHCMQRIGVVGIGWGSWMACYGAEYLGSEFACAVMHTPLLHILGTWDGASVPRLVGPGISGAIHFANRMAKGLRTRRTGTCWKPVDFDAWLHILCQEESSFKSTRHNFPGRQNVTTSDACHMVLCALRTCLSPKSARTATLAVFNRTAAFLRKFLWPFPLGGGYAYLRYLSGKGDVEAMTNLLELGVPAGGRDSHDEVEQAPVIYAAREGYGAACRVLVQYQAGHGNRAVGQLSADVNEVGGIARETALHVAVQHNKIKVVQTLLNLQADPHLQDAAGQAPLHRAARDGTVSCIQTLLAAAALVDPRDTCEQTPVHIACFFGREEVVSKLLAARADAVAENIRGQTPRKVADRQSFSTLVQLIDKEIERREIEEHYANEEREKQEPF